MENKQDFFKVLFLSGMSGMKHPFLALFGVFMLDEDLSSMVTLHGDTLISLRDFKSSCYMPDMLDVFFKTPFIFHKPTKKTDFGGLK